MRGHVLGFLAAVLVTVHLGAGTAHAADGTPPPVGARVGVNPGSGLLWESDTSRQHDLDAIVASGAHWTSLDVDWNSVQPDGPESFDWTVTDRAVREAHVRGLAIIGMVAYAPPWARPDSCPSGTSHCLPAQPEDYASFAKAAALRYGGNAFDASLRGSIETWQIWNEPNHFPFVQPRVDVGRYTEMLRRAYAEIKKVDRGSVVLAGGTAPAPDNPTGRDMAPVTFLEGIYSHGGGDSFDAFAHHPYSYPCNPLTNARWNAFFQTYWLHQVLLRHGDGDRKVWGTESGAPTGADVGSCGGGAGVSVSEADQARFAVDALRGWTQTFGRFTGPLLWYQIRDTSTDPQRTGDHFGLLRYDGTAKPAAGAFADFLTRPDVALLAPAEPPSPSPDPPPTPVPDPVPVPDPPPVTADCITQSGHASVVGTQAGRYTSSVSGHLAVDAVGATWTQVDAWPVSIDGGGSLCWDGGTIVGTWGSSTPWATFHHTGAFSFANPNSVIDNVGVRNYGDAINVRQGASNWTVQGAHTSMIHDDCLQDDFLYSGVIDGSLFDGCYVGLSTRASSNNSSSDGHNNTLTMRNSLLRLQPMSTVYKGPAPGTGGFFKWDDSAHRSPKLALYNNVFRADQPPNHGSLGLPVGYDVACSGNTIVWLGHGSFPEAASWLAKCPDTKIVTSASTWQDAVTLWNAQH